MRISVITPTFNSEETISENVNSIINQSYKNFEHIIIDNQSSDKTLELIESLYKKFNLSGKLKIISEKDNGIADAFNKGIQISGGNIIGILNCDDYYVNENVFNRILSGFNDAGVLFVHGNIFFADTLYGSNVRKPLLCKITKAMPYNHPSMFFRRSVFTDYGNYDVNFKYAMDFEFISRLVKEKADLDSAGYYIDGEPIIYMKAGGTSWRAEMETIKETKLALHKNNLWNLNARLNYFNRIMRTKMKQAFSFVGLVAVVRFWRKLKW